MGIYEEALELHRNTRGKLGVSTKVSLKDKHDLSLAYSPGVAEPCRRIYGNAKEAYEYTFKGNTVGVISDGSAVLGLGDIGALASLPVMEGKSALFKEFAGIDAFPVVLDSRSVEEIISAVKLMAPTFGGINLEDISAPRCFEIERRLKEELDIPVFHDDQHGTAVVTYAALMNALKLTGKKLSEVTIVLNGPGAAGMAIANLLISAGVGDIILCGRKGALVRGVNEGNSPYQADISKRSNRNLKQGFLADIIKGADVFIGVSVAGALTKEMVRSMNSNAIVLAMANPDPEITPDDALEAGAAVVGTGRSDYPNQVNNLLGFPGIFRGALDSGAWEINEEMKLAAALAIASLVTSEELRPDYIIPSPLDRRVVPAVASAVADAAVRTGVVRK